VSAKKVGRQNPLPTGGLNLETRVKRAVRRTWDVIVADVDWAPVRLSEAAELCLDADRCVTHGGLSPEDYEAVLALPSEVPDRWAREALRPLFD
jgi:hypothetical protein